MKKAGVYILLAIGFVVLFFLGTFVVMFFAPGVEIFGIKYLANGISRYARTVSLLESYVGDIYIDTQEVPVTIQYTQGISSVTFIQNFIGFTKTKEKQASLNIYSDDDGNIHIETSEIIKFLYANYGKNDYQLVVNLAQSKGEHYKDVFVKSDNSDIFVKSASGTQTGIINQNFSVITDGRLVVSNTATINTQNFKFHTTQKITIADYINSKNLDLKTENNDIEIRKAIDGAIVAKTNNGNIKFVSCNSLNATTVAGDILSYSSGANEVKKSVNITTRTGDITLGKVSFEDSSAVLKIQTASGDVSISQMQDGEISNERGDIFVAIANVLVITNPIGGTKVDQVSQKITIVGKNGKVELGQGGEVANPSVETTTGAIYVKNASGIINLVSTANVVEIDCVDTGVSKVDVSAGKSLKATDLSGETTLNIYGGDASVSFASISGNVKINVKGYKSKNLTVNATCENIENVNYSSASSKGKTSKVYAGDTLVKSGSSVSSAVIDGNYSIEIKSEYASVTLKFSEQQTA